MAGGKWIGTTYKRQFVPDRDNKKGGDNTRIDYGILVNKTDKVKGYYHGYEFAIRVPSLKRNKYTWKNFYTNYPGIYRKAKESGIWEWNGFKLKKMKLT